MEGIRELTPVFPGKYKKYVMVYIRDIGQYEVKFPYSVLEELNITTGDRVQLYSDRFDNLYIKKDEEGELITGSIKRKQLRIYSKSIACTLIGDRKTKAGKFLCRVVEINGDKLMSICNRTNHI